MELQRRKNLANSVGWFNLKNELCKHAWFPNMTETEAEEKLRGESAYTYLLRQSQENRKYCISYVDANGLVRHDSFALVNPRYGIFLNGHSTHVGKLAKVIRDSMCCDYHLGQPVAQ